MSTAALLLGREEQGIDLATRAHEAYLGIDDAVGAARCATWIGLYLGGKGDDAPSGGWLARARRVAAASDTGSAAAEGLLLVAVALEHLYEGDPAGAERMFAGAFTAGRRVHDRDAMTLAQLGQGQALLMLGDPPAGLALLDEAMVAVTAGEVSPVASGVVYCSVIGTCHLAFDVRRARQWTVALEHWCGDRPDMVMFTGQCQAHRAALYCLHGAWGDAMAAARVAQERVRAGRLVRRVRRVVPGGRGASPARRVRRGGAVVPPRRGGRLPAAARPGAAATRTGPGAGRTGAGARGGRAGRSGDQTALLVAVVEIELAAGDAAAAREAADELTRRRAVDADAHGAGARGAVRRGGAHRGGRRGGCARRVARRLADPAGARHAVRGGPVPGAHGAGVARARR